GRARSEEHTSELQSLAYLVCRLMLEKKKVSAEVDLVHQQTQNQVYGSSHIGATAKDISNFFTDAVSGVVDIFHGIDKAVADTWNNFSKDGKADGIGSNLSRIFFSGYGHHQDLHSFPTRRSSDLRPR